MNFKRLLYPLYKLLLANNKKKSPKRKKQPKKIEKKTKSEVWLGQLDIGYVSRIKTNKRGREYAYIPKSIFSGEDRQNLECSAIIYLDKISAEQENSGLYQGYGKLKGTFRKRGEMLVLESFKSFKPKLKNIKTKVNLADATFSLRYLALNTENGVFQIDKKNTPFNFSPYINKITKNKSYREFLANQKITIKSKGRKVGYVRKYGNEWIENTYWEQYGEAENWDFSGCNVDEIEENFNQYKQDKRYEKLVKELKNMKSFTSYSNLKKRFRDAGSPVTTSELNDMFFHSGYDEDIFKVLQERACETYVDNLSFVFKIKDQKERYVWEVPNRALATYIFNDKLEYNRLFERLKNTPRMIIRQNKEIQQELGFKGFVIHTGFDSWSEKFKELLSE